MPPKSYLSAVRPDAPPPSTAPIGKSSSSSEATVTNKSSPPSTSTTTSKKQQSSASSRSRKQQNHSSTHDSSSTSAANTSAKCAHCSYTNFGLYRDPENKRLYCRMCWFDFYAEFPDNDKHRYVGRGCTEHSMNAVEPKWKQVVHDYRQFERYVKMHCAWTHRNEQMQEKLELTRARIHFYPQGHPATVAEEMKNEGETSTANDDETDYQYAPISDTYIPYFPISEPGASELDIYSPFAEFEEQDELAKQYKEQQKLKQEGQFYGKPVPSCNGIIEVMLKQDDGTYYLRQKMQEKDPENFGMSNKKNLTKFPPDFLPHSKKKQLEQQEYYDQYYKEHIDQRFFWDENYQMYYYYDEHQQPQWYYGEETAEMRRQRSIDDDEQQQQHEEETHETNETETETEKKKELHNEQESDDEESTAKKFPRLHCDTGVEYSVHIKRLDKKTHKWQFVLLQLIEVDFGTYAVSERKGLIGFKGLCDCHFFDSVSSARHFFHRLFYNKTHNDWLKCSMNFLEFHPVDDFYHLSISNEVEDVKKELHRQEKVREGAPDTYQTFCSYVFDSYKVVDGVATVATTAKSTSSSSNQQQQQQPPKSSESAAAATNQQSQEKRPTTTSLAESKTDSERKQTNNKDDERDSSSSNGNDADTLTEGGEQPSSSKKVKDTKNNNNTSTSSTKSSQKTPEEQEQDQKEKIEAEKRLAEEKKKKKQQKHSSSSSGMMEEVMFMGGMAIVGIAAAGAIWFLKNRQTNKN